jgi:hypothetical protein
VKHAVQCEIYLINMVRVIYINSVRTSQETHYVSITKANRLMLFREIIAVVRIIRNTQTHCVNRMQSVLVLMHAVCIVTTVS